MSAGARDFFRKLGKPVLLRWVTNASPVRIEDVHPPHTVYAHIDLVGKRILWLKDAPVPDAPFASSSDMMLYVRSIANRPLKEASGEARSFLKSMGRRLRWVDEVQRGSDSSFAYDDTWIHPDNGVAGLSVSKVRQLSSGEWWIVYIEGCTIDQYSWPTKEKAQRHVEKLWSQLRKQNPVREAATARDWLKAHGPKLRWYPWHGINNRKYVALDPSFKHPDWIVAAVYTMGEEGVWHIEDVRDVSMKHFYYFVADGAADVMTKAEELWFNRANLAEAAEGSARTFLKSQAPKLKWTEDSRQGRRWRYGSDTSLTQVCRYWIARQPVAKILQTKDGWQVVRVEKVPRDYSPIYKTAEAAQEYAERLWYGVGRATWIALQQQTEAKEGSARAFFKAQAQVILQPANEGRDVIADSPWGRAYLFRRGDTVSLMGHEISDIKLFLPKLLAALKKAGFTGLSFRLTDRTDSWYMLLKNLGIRHHTSSLGWGTVAYVDVPL